MGAWGSKAEDPGGERDEAAGSAARKQAASGKRLWLAEMRPRVGVGVGDSVKGDPRPKSPGGGKGPSLQEGRGPLGDGCWARDMGISSLCLPDLVGTPGLSGRWWSTNGPLFGMKTHRRPP